MMRATVTICLGGWESALLRTALDRCPEFVYSTVRLECSIEDIQGHYYDYMLLYLKDNSDYWGIDIFSNVP
jgi:hypothetical protein